MRVKFKFKFVLTRLNYRAFCLFRFCKTVFMFKFKLILRKKKIYVNNFLTNFQLRLLISSARISSLLGNYVTIRLTRHTGRVRGGRDPWFDRLTTLSAVEGVSSGLPLFPWIPE